MSGDALTHGGSMRMKQPRLEGLFGAVRYKRPLELVTAGEAHRLLPDFECAHGRLRGDGTPPCGCYGSERMSMVEVRRLGALAVNRKIASGEIVIDRYAVRGDRGRFVRAAQ